MQLDCLLNSLLTQYHRYHHISKLLAFRGESPGNQWIPTRKDFFHVVTSLCKIGHPYICLSTIKVGFALWC